MSEELPDDRAGEILKFPVEKIRMYAIQMYKKILYSIGNHQAVMYGVEDFFEQLKTNRQSMRDNFLENFPYNDFELLIATFEYIRDHTEEIVELARTTPTVEDLKFGMDADAEDDDEDDIMVPSADEIH